MEIKVIFPRTKYLAKEIQQIVSRLADLGWIAYGESFIYGGDGSIPDTITSANFFWKPEKPVVFPDFVKYEIL